MGKPSLSIINGPRLDCCNFSIREVKKQPKKGSPIECEYSLEYKVKDNKKEIFISLIVSSDSEGIPFVFEVKYEAIFKSSKAFKKKEEAQEIVMRELIPQIFPYLKETVADLTRKANFKPFHLPPLEM